MFLKPNYCTMIADECITNNITPIQWTTRRIKLIFTGTKGLQDVETPAVATATAGSDALLGTNCSGFRPENKKIAIMGSHFQSVCHLLFLLLYFTMLQFSIFQQKNPYHLHLKRRICLVRKQNVRQICLLVSVCLLKTS